MSREPLNAEWVRRGRWSRLYLVDNSGGHVHHTMRCKTCYPTTRFVWLPEYSDKPAAEVVADAGALTCLDCFGSVRETILRERGIDPAKAKTKIEAPERRAARLAREAAKAERQRKAEIAGIVDAETGGELRVDFCGHPETLKTLRTARTWLTDNFTWSPKPAADVARVVEAIAKKEGKDECVVIAEARRRAAHRK